MTEPLMRDRTVNIMQACAVAGVTRRTIYNWIAANKIQYVRTASGRIRIVEASLHRPGNVPAPEAKEPVRG
jgi:excisionase family DNA binding protein